jgi:hypothetical protein
MVGAKRDPLPMSSARKLVLVVHQNREQGLRVKDEFLRLGVPACLVAEPGQLTRVVDTFRVHYVVTHLEAGSPLALSYADWLSTPGGLKSAIPEVNLRDSQLPGLNAICQAVAMDLRRS